MRWREFIAVMDSAGRWLVAALAQKDERVRRIGVVPQALLARADEVIE
jgi:hypothetical protein